MKRKLLLTVMLVIASVWTQSAWAQSWTGCEVKSGYALLYNVGTEKFFTRGNNWDTRASVGDYGAAMTVSLDPVGSYFKIRTTNTYGVESLNGGTVYTDQARGKNSTWEFVEVDAVNHIYNIVSRDNHEAGSGAYLTAEGGSSTIVGPGSDGTSTNAQWKVFMIDDMPDVMQSEMTNASATNPVDVSVFIKDATFASYGEMANSVWANNGGCNLNGGSMTNPCAEKWCGSFSITQTISNVPNGKYQMTGQAFYRIDGSMMKHLNFLSELELRTI